jgi:glycerol-3-phosphate dehydrogenase
VTADIRYDVAVVGAGVVGLAIARELVAHGLTVAVLEALDDVGEGTSKANTAILHTGFDAAPGTVEAQLVRRGYDLLSGYAAAAGIAVERTGALLVAWDGDQLGALPGLAAKAAANGYPHTRPVGVDELYRLEPHLGRGALGALAVPDEGIVDPWSTPLAFATEAVLGGAELLFGHRLDAVVDVGDGTYRLRTPAGPVSCRWLVNAAGLYADAVDALLGHHDFTVRPRRGELVVFDKLARAIVGHILLPVPTARGKGVLVAPTVFGNVLLGPTADDVDDRTDTASSTAGLAMLRERGRSIMPQLLAEEVTAVYAGLRAATEHSDYSIRLHAPQRYVCVGGIRSTGLTASMAIGEHVVALLREGGLALRDRLVSDPPLMPALGEASLRPYQRDDLVASDPAYGRIVCHCERVSMGELRDALVSVVPARSLDGLRRRTRALNGRCQGFHCGAAVRATLEHTVPGGQLR